MNDSAAVAFIEHVVGRFTVLRPVVLKQLVASHAKQPDIAVQDDLQLVYGIEDVLTSRANGVGYVGSTELEVNTGQVATVGQVLDEDRVVGSGRFLVTKR